MYEIKLVDVVAFHFAFIFSIKSNKNRRSRIIMRVSSRKGLYYYYLQNAQAAHTRTVVHLRLLLTTTLKQTTTTRVYATRVFFLCLHSPRSERGAICNYAHALTLKSLARGVQQRKGTHALKPTNFNFREKSRAITTTNDTSYVIFWRPAFGDYVVILEFTDEKR